MIPMKRISIVTFRDLFDWSVAHLLNKDIGFTKHYPIVRIGDVIRRSTLLVTVEDNVLYSQITLKTNGGGAVLRGKKLGKDIGTKKQYLAKEGQFIMSKIDARNGAFGVVTKELDNAIVTGDFPLFDVNQEKINPYYLYLLSSTRPFVQYAQSCSRGTTNRQRIDMDAFLSQQIPLPSLEEQRTIIQEHLNKNKQAEYVEEEVAEVVKETRKWLMNNLGISINNEIRSHYKLQFIRYKSLEKWSISEIQRYDKYSYDDAKYEVIKIGDIILSFEGGKTPSTKCKEYWGEDVYWVSAKDMKELYLSNIQDKLSLKGVEDTKLKVYPSGTILGVFRSGILRHSFPVCITVHPVTINQDLKAFGINERKVSKLYFLFYLNLLQDIVLNVAMKKGVTVESINTDAFMEIPFICPPLDKQNEIVDHILASYSEQKNLQQQASYLRTQAQQQFEQTIFE